MSVPFWVTDTAERFWTEVGALEPFPRNLRQPIARGLPLAVVLLPMMSVGSIEQWLRRQEVLCHVGTNDRKLRACLVANCGQGLIFVDGADPDDEQRFSVAHELAHFLRDYWGPRREAVEHLGREILDVLDEMRPPYTEERTHALLSRISLDFHVHLMERTEHGDPATAAAAIAENNADRLAFELLAPSDLVMRELGVLPPRERNRAAANLLVDFYGLPSKQATQYAGLLAPESRPSDSLLQRLGLRP